MKLPGAEKAFVPQRKVTEYLLSHGHRDGRSKAAFFEARGFRLQTWEVLRDALVQHASGHDVMETKQSDFGTKFVVDGGLTCPDGTEVFIRSVWFIPADGDIPQLVTAHPLRRQQP